MKKNEKVIINKVVEDLMSDRIIVDTQIIQGMELITPTRAKKLLTRNIGNRPLSSNNTKTLSKTLINNEWQEDDQAIAISEDGILFNGQHRLLAICETGISTKIIVSYNVPRNSYINYDKVKSRNFADVLAMLGVLYYKNISESINIFHAKTERNTWSEKSGSKKHEQLTNEQKKAFYEQNKVLIDDAAAFVNKHKGKKPFFSLSRYMAFVLHLIINKKYNRYDVFHFFEQLMTGLDVKKNTIIHARSKFVEMQLHDKGTSEGMKYNHDAYIAILAQVWYEYNNGKGVRKTYTTQIAETDLSKYNDIL